tara:strand:+ start:569 stop:1273 length:705 start_codon:yes stop_codon:yes gene_type:complete
MSKKNTHRIISIINHEQWGLNFEAKREQWYYKMPLDFFSRSNVFPLSSGAKVVLLDILKESLRQKTGHVSYCLEYAKTFLKVSLDDTKGVLKELKDNNIIELDKEVRRQYIEENRREENRSINDSKKESNPNQKIDWVGEAWNNFSTRVNEIDPSVKISKVKVPLSQKRKTHVKKMLAEIPDRDSLSVALRAIAQNDFNLGKNDRGWVADFDWFIRPTSQNYLKYYELGLANEN